MNTHQTLQQALEFSTYVVLAYIDDLTDDELLTRPGTGCNHLAWQLGHVLASGYSLLNLIKEGSVKTPFDLEGKYTKETSSLDDPASFLTKQAYRDHFQALNAKILETLGTLSDEDFDLPAPERIRSLCPTLGSVAILMVQHPMMHAGQFVPVRRQLGKPVII